MSKYRRRPTHCTLVFQLPKEITQTTISVPTGEEDSQNRHRRDVVGKDGQADGTHGCRNQQRS